MIAEKHFAGRQSRGARFTQEDACAFSEVLGAQKQTEGILAVVADGLGGHAAGQQASKIALQNFVAAFHEAASTITDRLKIGLSAANDAIADEVKRNPDCEGMATTLLATTVTNAGMEWISVGDSPLFLFHERRLDRINEDHSLRPVLKELAEQGEISFKESSSSAKNVLRAALTGDEISLVDIPSAPRKLHEGDLIIAATDGIWTLQDQEIEKICAEFATADAKDLAAKILEAVRDAGNPKQDNVTIAIIKAPVSSVS